MRVLIVEDEPRTAAYIRKGLMEQAFVVDVAHNGIEGLHLATTGNGHHLHEIAGLTPGGEAEHQHDKDDWETHSISTKQNFRRAQP